MKKKNGNITMTITFIASFAFLLILVIYMVNMITPFIWYQKLDNIVSKYMYVVEKFGYLTDIEEQRLYQELQQEGFEKDKIVLDCPKQKQQYGTLFKFEISYELEQEYSIIQNGIKNEARTISLHIRKYSYSKV